MCMHRRIFTDVFIKKKSSLISMIVFKIKSNINLKYWAENLHNERLSFDNLQRHFFYSIVHGILIS